MLQKTKGVVLHSLKYNDAFRIVNVYTEPYGCMAYMVPVSRPKRGNGRSAACSPLAIVEFESDYKESRPIQRMREVRPVYLFRSLPYDPYKSAVALFLAEFLYRVLREEGENAPLFAYLDYSIRRLDQCERGTANFHLVFLMRLSMFLGIFPNIEGYYPGVCFDLRNACFAGRVPPHADYLRPEEASRLAELMRMDYDTMRLFRMSRTERLRCLEVIEYYYRLHLPAFPKLKSLDVLKELFD